MATWTLICQCVVCCVVLCGTLSPIPTSLKRGIYLQCYNVGQDVAKLTIIEDVLSKLLNLSYTDIRIVCKNMVLSKFYQTKSQPPRLYAYIFYQSDETDVCLFEKVKPLNGQPYEFYVTLEFCSNNITTKQLLIQCTSFGKGIKEQETYNPVVLTDWLSVDCAMERKGPAVLSMQRPSNYKHINLECKDAIFYPGKRGNKNQILAFFDENSEKIQCVFQKPGPGMYTLDVYRFEDDNFDNYTIKCFNNSEITTTDLPTLITTATAVQSTSSTTAIPTDDSTAETVTNSATETVTTSNMGFIMPIETNYTDEPTPEVTTSRKLLVGETSTSVQINKDTTNWTAENDKDFILRVQPHCAKEENRPSWIIVITDLGAVTASAVCKDGNRYTFWSKDGVHYQLDLYYKEPDYKSCVFSKRKDVNVYSVEVAVAIGDAHGKVQRVFEQVQITCTLDEHFNLVSESSRIKNTLIAPKEIQQHVGVKSKAAAVLYLSDVLGRPLKSRSVHLGRKVQLVALTNGSEGERGIKPVSCDAIGANNNARFAILRGGCGDGIVIARDDGFDTDGLYARSPYFPAFQMSDDTGIRFECNVTLCRSRCDSNSCHAERRKRHLSKLPSDQNASKDFSVIMETEIIRIKSEGDDCSKKSDGNVITSEIIRGVLSILIVALFFICGVLFFRTKRKPVHCKICLASKDAT